MTIIGKPCQFQSKCKTDVEEKGNWNQFQFWVNKGNGKYSASDIWGCSWMNEKESYDI